MKKTIVNNTRIGSFRTLVTPDELVKEYPCSENLLQFIQDSRQTVSNIVHHKDHRLLVICGPCSVHDIDAGLEYAKRLKKLHEELNDRIYIVMRVYFEKPRTTIGWKGFINDPDLNGTFNISEGLRKARKFLINLAEMKLPVATEMLDPISPQYLADLVSWASIGARTIESQTHREMASGLSMPVGLKNGTDGSLDTAINALKAASSPHNFIGVNPRGQVALVSTNGNPDGHVILRGGKQPNYNLESLSKCEQALESAGLNKSIVIDCSHGNSNNDYTRQPLVALDVVDRVHKGMSSVVGIMLESNLNEGNQSISSRTDDMKYGVSVTDACIDWETTEKLLHRLHSTKGVGVI